ncbi:T9SS type B sorting domain-containing protein [Arcticibacterium luteifluviistationis]|nr:gliding motility-associated C-terminal domain-containing protein [Arcticibacterium luteifluviistationis]
MKKYLSYLLVPILFFLANQAHATHIRAGEITAERISNTSLTYRVTLTTYTDEVGGRSANEAQEDVDFYPGFVNNGVVSYKVPRSQKVLISPTTVRNTYVTTVTFPGPGLYKISCGIPNRNEATINLPQPSDDITFFVQTTLLINSAFGLNSTPVLLNIPVDSAAVGVKFIHNPGAFDIDGDSLSYKLAIPMEDSEQANGIGGPIEGYVDPSLVGDAPIRNEADTGPATFKIDARTGDLIWDAPQKIGQYNVAFTIEEWRKAPDGTYARIGVIVRDMQIIVVETDNRRPELEVPNDFCVEAGDLIEFEVLGTDDDEDQSLKITTNGGVYNLGPGGEFKRFIADSAAKFNFPAGNNVSPVTGKFTWQTNCGHVREQSYDVLFKVEDSPGRFITQLVDIKTVKINVNPQRVKGLTGEETEDGVALRWQQYPECTGGGKLLVYRKDGCSGLNPGVCEQGMPDAWRYVKIGEVDLGDTTFIDTNAENGQIYSYRLVAEVGVSQFNTMLSSPSTEFCIGSELPKRVPVITHVDIQSTNNTNGEITVKWSKPIGLDTADFKGPYSYKIFRTEGLGGDNFVEVTTINTTLGDAADTLFFDTGLNTLDLVYKYKLAFYYEADKLMGEAPAATSVRLKGSPDDRQINLSWEANTPWSNDNQTHLVYREDKGNPGVFNIIAEVEVVGPNTYTYTDKGEDSFLADGDQSIVLENNIEYCYKVVTRGVYGNEASMFGILENSSQEYCMSPADRTPPCPLVINLEPFDCENVSQEAFCGPNAFTNNLNWSTPESAGGVECRSDLIRYNVYYSRFPDGNFEQIGITDGTARRYNHVKNPTDGFAGCYYVTAVSILDVESEPSNIVCADNCNRISFPNVFSPNGDGRNDTFEPMNCPGFIKSIGYEIYNRQGLLVAEGEGTSLSWDGRGINDQELSVGTYFYLIKVQFNRLEENSDVFTYKGYLELVK